MKFLSPRILGIIGIIGAPWMFIDFVNNGLYEHFMLTPISGMRNFIFMAGWICSVIGLYKLGAEGNKRLARTILIIQLVLLLLAAIWSIMVMIAPNSPSKIFYALNFSWPLGGCFMVATGLVILLAKKLKGWKRFAPLLAGLWFPQTILIYAFTQNSVLLLMLSGIYSTIAFSLLGLAVATETDRSLITKAAAYKS
ncbi:MAG TPA: hypothetical protein VEV83_11565 [Parafilimonas sp.]|nr:hypothetical protein [Parafilimonas sp.]